MFAPKLIAFDLDGTLAESKQRLSADMGELLSQLTHKMPVAVLSGGGWPQFEAQFLLALPDDTKLEHLYLFPDNAAQCYIYRNARWSTYYNESFSDKESAHIFTCLEEALEETGFANPTYQIWGERIEDRGAEITFSALGQEAPLEIKHTWDPTKEKRRPLYELLLKKLPECSIGLNATTSIDITRKGVNKAFGVRKLAGLTELSVAEMLYVGDALDEGGNDSVVIETGIKTHQVFGPEETTKVIEEILAK